MSSFKIEMPFPLFADVDGDPLNNGYVYIGQTGLNAETNQIQAYWDANLSIPAAQPVRTINGYLSRNGSPGKLYIDGSGFSILVKNKNGSLVWSDTGAVPEITESIVLQLDTVADLYGVTGTTKLQQVSLSAWNSGTALGGGILFWDGTKAKSAHNGGTVFSPTVPFTTVAAYLAGTGETDPAGTGCWVRAEDGVPSLYWFGGTSLADTDSVNAAQTYVSNNSNEAKVYQRSGNIVIGGKPLPFTASNRDAFQVSRNLDGKTDCHAFADKTTIDNASDAGTYGTFDSQTEVAGSHTQNHQFSFQDRAKFSGSGTLQTWGNIIWPEMPGSGTVNNRYDWEIKDITGSLGSIGAHIGLYVRDFARAASNVAINLEQSTGYSVFAPNAGKWQIGGNFAVEEGALASFGTLSPVSGVPLTFTAGAASQKGFLSSSSTAVNLGVSGDYDMGFVINAANRVVIESSPDLYALRPGADNSQPLGNASFRWSVVYAGTGTINTSDERTKQQISGLTEKEKAVALAIKGLIRSFKFNDSVDEKGDAARIHMGVVAQDVKAAFEAEGLDPFKYGILCYDSWGEKTETVECLETDEGAYFIEEQEQVTEQVSIFIDKIEIRNGVPVMVKAEEIIDKPVIEQKQVFNEDGEVVFEDKFDRDENGDILVTKIPLLHNVPVTKTVKKYYRDVTTPAGDLYGIRYEELFAFIIGAM